MAHRDAMLEKANHPASGSVQVFVSKVCMCVCVCVCVCVCGIDTGVYIRTTPRSTVTPKGDWFAVNGNLPILEVLSATYHGGTKILVLGAQVP